MAAAGGSAPGVRSASGAAGTGTARVDALVDVAVAGLGGARRAGQHAMARAVAAAVRDGHHLLVQAGTGTGKSLAYLVPVLEHALRTRRPVVVSTATLALQAQVVDRDLPRLADALAGPLGRRPTFGLVKGRRNYVCRHKLAGHLVAEEEPLAQLPLPQSAAAASGDPGAADGPVRPGTPLGREVVRLRAWAQETTSGDRDELVPGVSERAWRQVSVSAAECLGAQRCPAAAECFVEVARQRARASDVVVTNHAVTAIDAFEGRQLLPEHDVLVVDEAHELADRVTGVVSAELTPTAVDIAARRARAAGAEAAARLGDTAAGLGRVLEALPPGRLPGALPPALGAEVVAVRDAARAVASGLRGESGGEVAGSGERHLARAAVGEVFDVAERLAAAEPADVRWVSATQRRGPVLHVAPLSVAGRLRAQLFPDRTVVLTSATLALGGSFDAIARGLGLRPADRLPETADRAGPTAAADTAGTEPTAVRGDGAGAVDDFPVAPAGAAAEPSQVTPSQPWRGLDVGSPFDYARQSILYVARHLPPPGRGGAGSPATQAQLDELAELVEAAGGRTLGLFSSRRAAEVAAEAMRTRLTVPVLCQGDDATPTLVRAFARDAATCLFGTLSLWQGVDVPGPACQLVVIDRIPFPRPDDPLQSARQEAVAAAGGNGFLAVTAASAALLLAQGAGRLIRSGADRGVVAVLDSRLATAGYAGFLRASLPPSWPTTDRARVLEALRRIDADAGPVWPVADPGERDPGAAPGPRSSRTAVAAGRAWSAAEDAALRAAVSAGDGLAAVADHIGCTLDQARRRCEGLALRLP